MQLSRAAGQEIAFKGLEYLDTPQLTDEVAVGSVVFSTAVNPNMFNGSRLSAFARLFEQYRLSLTVHYAPTCSATERGALAMAWDADVRDSAPIVAGDQAVREFMGMTCASRPTGLWQPMSMKLPQSPWLWCAAPEAAETRLEDHGQFYLYLAAAASESELPFSPGMLYVTYEVEFRKFANHIDASEVGLYVDVVDPGDPVVLGAGANVVASFATNYLVSEGAAAGYSVEHSDDNELVVLNDYADAAAVPPTLTIYPGTFLLDTQTCVRAVGTQHVDDSATGPDATLYISQQTAIDPDDIAASFVVPEGGTLSIVAVEGHGDFLSLESASDGSGAWSSTVSFDNIANVVSRYVVEYFHPKGLPAVNSGDQLSVEALSIEGYNLTTFDLEDIAWEILKVAADWAVTAVLSLPATPARDQPRCGLCRMLRRHLGDEKYAARRPGPGDAWHYKCVNGKLVCVDAKPKFANRHAHLPGYATLETEEARQQAHAAYHRSLFSQLRASRVRDEPQLAKPLGFGVKPDRQPSSKSVRVEDADASDPQSRQLSRDPVNTLAIGNRVPVKQGARVI
jgi:hypothetical protein